MDRSRSGAGDYGKRMLWAAASAFLLLYTTVFVGPLDIVNANRQYLTFSAGALFWPLLGLTLAGTAVLAALMALMRGRSFGAALGIVTALALMAYLQGAVLDGRLASLDGSEFRWQDDPAAAWSNLALWIAAVAVLGVLGALLSEKARFAAAIVCAALFLGQTAALVVSWVPEEKEQTNWQLSGDEEFTVSANNNILVITLDQTSPLIFEQVLEMDPALRETFRDFTYYDNMSSTYSLTFPSMCFLLTGQYFDNTIPVRDYVYNAWHSDGCAGIWDGLRDAGYTRRVYVESNYAALTAENMLGKFDNVVQAGPMKIRWQLLWRNMAMSFYRYFPTMAKNSFDVSTGAVLDVASYRGVDKLRINYDFYKTLRDEGLKTQEQDSFAWYHLQGAHFPFTVGYDGELLWPAAEENNENRLNQLHGYLLALDEFFEQLKELGVYDDATILISADHGYVECYQAVFLVKQPGQSFEEMELNHAPVSQEDIIPTILDLAGLDYTDYGTSVFDWNEGDERTRSTSAWGYVRDLPEVPWIGNVDQWDAEANGSERYNAMGVMYYTGDREQIMTKQHDWYYGKVADEILPLTDSFY